ncbi:ACT domain-containing protein [Candidatus Contubernalis alkaliaceticus]|uniref:ACT domain-containing protein n=1 Tax=Candidatus Contubernalis alkaliaceticus TaxID=338645 RepID=UPI001F4C30BB|nr:ACT domain-containing protein [Candidatus Contubernalis alkalaceticus]UNC91407.1 ACT domain-containing protein [Candidatus Contubernalis alkalaceticus]
MSQLKENPKGNRIIVSIMGPDRVGIISGVTGVLSDNSINILDISQTTLQEFLVMVLVADMEKSKVDLATLKELLNAKAKVIGVRIDAQHEDVFNFMHRI